MFLTRRQAFCCFEVACFWIQKYFLFLEVFIQVIEVIGFPPLPTWDQWKLVTQHVFVLRFYIELLNCFPTNTKYSLGLNRLVDGKNIWHITGIWEDLLIALKIYSSVEWELKWKTSQTACCMAYKHWHCLCWTLVEQVHTSKSEIPVQSMRKETNKSWILGGYLCVAEE